MKRLVGVLAVACLTNVIVATAVAADTPAVDFTAATWGSTGSPATMGFEFEVLESAQVTALGFFHPTTMSGSTMVGLWELGGSFLTSAVLDESGREGSGQWLWTAVTPVTLSAATRYVVGGVVVPFSPLYQSATEPTDWSVDPRISFVRPRVGNTSYGLEYPQYADSGYRYFGGNLKLYGPEPVPEPALVHLPILLTMGGACVLLRRRRPEVGA